MNFPERFFVTGTDTGVGKTLVCALLVAGLGGYYWKPVQSGASYGLDSAQVAEWAGLDPSHILEEKYVLQKPLSPHLAAQHENLSIQPEKMLPPPVPGTLILEGAGGIMVPLNRDTLILDWVRSLGFPVLVVAENKLGVINHTLLTVQALRSHQIPVLGVVLNRGVNKDHSQAIENFGQVQVLAQVEELIQVSPQVLEDRFKQLFG